MATHKVVICVDGSNSSENAFKWYLKTFYSPSHKILLVHVPELWKYDMWMSPGRVHELIEEAKIKTKQLQEAYHNMCTQMELNADFKILDGKEAWHEVCKYAESEDAKAIVVGTRGLGKLKRAVLGSVSAAILHHSHVPVLVYKEK